MCNLYRLLFNMSVLLALFVSLGWINLYSFFINVIFVIIIQCILWRLIVYLTLKCNYHHVYLHLLDQDSFSIISL